MYILLTHIKKMGINSISSDIPYSSINFNPLVEFPVEEKPSWHAKFRQSKCFKYMKKIIFAIVIINLMGWGNMLLFITIGVANKTMPDENTRKMWIEIDFQVINGIIFVMIAAQTPWRIRDIYHFYREKHRPALLQRHKYTNNLIWLQLILWSLILNSLFQFLVAICLWSMDMHTRPMWLVNVFGGCGLITGVFPPLTQFILGRAMKKKQESTNIV